MSKTDKLKIALALEELEAIEEVKDGFFDGFIEREFINQHRIIFFHTSHVKNKWMYYCTHCNSFHIIDSNWKDGSVHTCDGCHRRFTVQRYSKIEPIKDYIIKFETNRRKELIIRYFYFVREIRKTKYGYDEYHAVREIGRVNKNYAIALKRNTNRYMGGAISHDLCGDIAQWKADKTAIWVYYSTNHVYKHNLSKIMEKTGYQYSGFKEAIKKGFKMPEYLYIYKQCSKIEQIVKSDATKYLIDMINAMYFYGVDRFTALLNKSTKNQMSQIIRHDLSFKEAELLINNIDESNPDFELIKMMAKTNYYKTYESAKKVKRILKYICDYNMHDKRISYRDYNDYIEMSTASGASFDKYPKDFWASHDNALKEFKISENKNYDKLIRRRSLSKELSCLIYSNKNFMIRPVISLKELCIESEKLHHCVRKYAKDVAFGDTNIFFIRDTSNKEEPFVTLELKGKKVNQCRAKYNAKPSNEVINFVNKWCSMNNIITCF